MSHVFTFYDVNEAYHELQTLKHHFTVKEDTRNGKAWVFDAPVIVTHGAPWRRVLFDPVRDANPFFHFMESVWMLAGAENVDFPAYFASNIRNYSDDGETLHGAYGHRWRRHFGFDQINEVIELLKYDFSTRRAVLSMWDPMADLVHDALSAKDLPCNTHVYFRVKGDYLEMTVCNRSNDLVWGMLGANVVHMSYLQEYVANAINKAVGSYYQFTNNLHIYDGWERKYGPPDRWYSRKNFQRIAWSPESLSIPEIKQFVQTREPLGTSPVMVKNIAPMIEAWELHKMKGYPEAIRAAEFIYDDDWRYACVQWLKRRAANVAETQEG